MKRNVFVILSGILSAALNTAVAQKPETALGRLDYNMVLAYETIGEAQIHIPDFKKQNTLLFGDKSSIDMERLPSASNIFNAPANSSYAITTSSGNGGNLFISFKEAFPDIQSISYRSYPDNYFLFIQNSYGVSVIQDDYLPPIDWELSEEQKEISGYVVHKAEGTFRGRNYTVWYAKDIPVPAGPWKLHGLPGLILEAYDDTNEVKMLMTNLEFPLRDSILIEKPIPGYEQVSQQEYMEILRKRNAGASTVSSQSSSNEKSTIIKVVSLEKK